MSILKRGNTAIYDTRRQRYLVPCLCNWVYAWEREHKAEEKTLTATRSATTQTEIQRERERDYWHRNQPPNTYHDMTLSLSSFSLYLHDQLLSLETVTEGLKRPVSPSDIYFHCLSFSSAFLQRYPALSRMERVQLTLIAVPSGCWCLARGTVSTRLLNALLNWLLVWQLHKIRTTRHRFPRFGCHALWMWRMPRMGSCFGRIRLLKFGPLLFPRPMGQECLLFG